MKTNEKSLRILLICQTMTYLSGSPLYNYTLALELKKRGHDVSIYSMWKDNDIKKNLTKEKILTWHEYPKGEFDLVIISQVNNKDVLDIIKAKKVINVVHSEYKCETPIISDKIDQYITIRPSIKKHLVEEHKIPENKVSVIYNGIDFERFSPDKRKIHDGDYTKVVLPCTMDMLRIKFLEYYTKRANKKFRVYIYGTEYDNYFYRNEWVFVKNEKFDIENYIADADYVAGILLGRINLESRAMGIISYIHDPVDPNIQETYYPNDKEFKERHDIVNVVEKIIKLAK